VMSKISIWTGNMYWTSGRGYGSAEGFKSVILSRYSFLSSSICYSVTSYVVCNYVS
jgi:hypothetical protein